MPEPAATMDVHDGIAVVTLNRPEVLNAFTDAMEEDLINCLDETDADDRVKGVVITGAGAAFCAGMDLRDDGRGGLAFERWRTSLSAPAGTVFEQPGDDLPMRWDGGGRVVLRMFDSLKPIAVAINGHAIGVGITMTLAADVRLLAPDAKIAFPFTRRGFVPESCSSWFLPRIVRLPVALEWLYSGRSFGAEEALRQGLVDEVCEDVVSRAVDRMKTMLTQTSAVSVAVSRRLVWSMLGAPDPHSAHEIETLALNVRGVSPDAEEGVNAFLERREPDFPDRVSRSVPDAVRALRKENPPTPR